ncbi:MAG: gamma-glutamyl-gamma-aminobutyrate hydrolase family protein [Eubacteriales bacterium]
MRKTDRPVIGITTSMQDKYIRMNRAYFDAVLDAGGLPVFLPFSGGADDAARFLPLCDGIIFAGGVDVDPKHYGEEIKFDTVEVAPLRDEFELALAELIKGTDIPILGICRGEQLLNVAFGGTLHQHIEGHAQTEPGARNLRPARISEGTLLSRLAGKDEIFTNSFHHQAVKDVAPGMVAAAVAEDGVIEAVEPLGAAQSNRFFLAVQWHPELFYKTDTTASAIFKAFIEAARR